MSNYEASMRRAQIEYDNRTPPEDGPTECETCSGSGSITTSDGQGNTDDETCPDCKGFRLIDENGEPFDPHKAEHDACDYADYKRDEALTREPADYGNDF